MRIEKIKRYDIANGKGIRCTIYVNGCTHHCKGCFNSELWDFQGGVPFEDKKAKIFELLADEHCKGLTVLGGEQLQQGEDMLNFLREVKATFPDKNIWLWTGYYLNELNDLQKEIISLCDYVVDGRFDETKTGKHLLFRGSSNQTIWENRNGKFERSEMNDIVK